MAAMLQLVTGFTALIVGAAWLVSGSSALAKRLGVSDLMIGLTVVAFGTSAPELFVSVYAATTGNAAVAIGNVLGSNAFNVLVILGISAAIYPIGVGKSTVRKEIPLSLLSAVLLFVMANDRRIDRGGFDALTRIDGLVLLAFFTVFAYYTVGIARQDAKKGGSREAGGSVLRAVGLVVVGLAGLAGGARLAVAGAVAVARSWGMSDAVVSLTIVAAGTSLPELATSAVAAYRKNADIAVGNVVGSNIFNILLILGAASVIRPLPFEHHYNADVLVVMGSHLLLLLWMFTGKKRKIDRWEGVLLLLAYVLYMALSVLRR